MIDGKVELSDLVYDFIREQCSSATQSPANHILGGTEIFIDGIWACLVQNNRIYSYQYPYCFGNGISPTDPLLFGKLTNICNRPRGF